MTQELNVNPQTELFFDTDENRTELLCYGLSFSDNNNNVVEVSFDSLESLEGCIEIVKQLDQAVHLMDGDGVQSYVDQVEVVDLDASTIDTTEDIQGWDLL